MITYGLFLTNEVFDKITDQGINVNLYFDIRSNGQPFHQKCSELAPKRRSGTLT